MCAGRLSPLLEWERGAREELLGLQQELDRSRASLQLAASERDALLRENDKIILHARNVRAFYVPCGFSFCDWDT
jgi:hypothetical protein